MLSDRLQNIADYVISCDTMIDVGTDHGYIPIWLVKNNICKKAIAADVSKGSCQKAFNNIVMNRLSDLIEVRCGNGLKVLDYSKDCVDCVVISGMGGLLMVDILEGNPDILKNVSQLVLQPQKDIDKVRKFIINNGFKIVDEKMLKDNNKYYTIINAIKGNSDTYTDIEIMFGKILISNKSKYLKEYMTIELNKIKNAINSLKSNLNENNTNRYIQLSDSEKIYEEVLKCL